jgi:hypothetical protein
MTAHTDVHGEAHAHAHAHAHVHDHARAPSLASRAAVGRSLLRLSLAERLAIAGVFVAGIWLSVYWAIA